MRFFAVASLFSLGAALPATGAPASDANSLVAARADVSAVEVRAPTPAQDVKQAGRLAARGYLYIDETVAWPADQHVGGGLDASYRVTKVASGRYEFQYWVSGPKNGHSYEFIVSSGGTELDRRSKDPQNGSTAFELPQVGSNFRIVINAI
ncbi:hypothetical protein CSOJ01_12892 [Colletotrichum sojae]|uniref:Uncharacterized protein n=1 Tax=Colletotrichum sojae TaxID=2175907 RepID=A0A8H6IUP4_9PEZI|nr:hypothetical protein CSOJ01_12892 [Colletotrichum sojae]